MVEPDNDDYISPETKGHAFFAEHFDDPAVFSKRWVRSEAKKDDADDLIAKYDGNYFNYTVWAYWIQDTESIEILKIINCIKLPSNILILILQKNLT